MGVIWCMEASCCFGSVRVEGSLRPFLALGCSVAATAPIRPMVYIGFQLVSTGYLPDDEVAPLVPPFFCSENRPLFPPFQCSEADRHSSVFDHKTIFHSLIS